MQHASCCAATHCCFVCQILCPGCSLCELHSWMTPGCGERSLVRCRYDAAANDDKNDNNEEQIIIVEPIEGAMGSSGGWRVRELSDVCLHNNANVARGILVTNIAL